MVDKVSNFGRVYVFASIHCDCRTLYLGTSIGRQGQFAFQQYHDHLEYFGAHFLVSQYAATGLTDSGTCVAIFQTHVTDEIRYGGENLNVSYGFGPTADRVLQSWVNDAESTMQRRQMVHVHLSR
jgi:hypothetical protein